MGDRGHYSRAWRGAMAAEGDLREWEDGWSKPRPRYARSKRCPATGLGGGAVLAIAEHLQCFVQDLGGRRATAAARCPDAESGTEFADGHGAIANGVANLLLRHPVANADIHAAAPKEVKSLNHNENDCQ
jgi:hypothetical protein